jgi:hypothetical protein
MPSYIETARGEVVRPTASYQMKGNACPKQPSA